jgi:hypothetical protein
MMFKDKMPECKFRHTKKGIEVFLGLSPFEVSKTDSSYNYYISEEFKRKEVLRQIEQASSELEKDLAYLKFSCAKNENDEYSILSTILKKFLDNYGLKVEKEGRTSYGDYLYTVEGLTFRTTFKMERWG